MLRSASITAGAAGALAAVLLLAGCGSRDSGDTASTPAVTTPTVTATVTASASAPATSNAPAPGLSVSGVIAPSKSDPFITALRRAADTGAQLTIAIEVPRSEVEVPAGDTDVAIFEATNQNPVYLIQVNDHFRQECAAGQQLGTPDFRMCQTVTVKRDPDLLANYVTPGTEADFGDDAFALTTIS